MYETAWPLLPLTHEGHLFEIALESLILSVLADVGGDQHQYGARVEYDDNDNVTESADTVVLVTTPASATRSIATVNGRVYRSC